MDVDPIRLVQVVTNLLTNAAKYTDEGGRVTLRAAPSDREVVFSVTDTGVGLAPEAIPTLWDLFTQVRDTLDKAQGGLGIGLTLVRRLVEMHGGTVTARGWAKDLSTATAPQVELTVGASSICTASSSASWRRAPSRGAAMRIPGTSCSMARSQMP